MTKYVAICLYCALMLAPFCYSQSFSLKLHLEKNDYLIREPITILAELTNNDSHENLVILPNFSFGGLNLIMKDDKGLAVPRLSRGFPNVLPRIIIKPNEHAYIILPVTPSAYAHNVVKADEFEGFIETGVYTVQFEYSYNEEKIYSNIEQITISEAINKDDINALKDFDAIIEKIYSKNSKLNINQTDLLWDNFIELIQKYPETEYLTQIYYRLYLHLSLSNPERIIEFLPDLCYKKPNSFRTLLIMNSNKDFSSELLKDSNMQEKVSGTLIEKYFEKIKKYHDNVKSRGVDQNDK